MDFKHNWTRTIKHFRFHRIKQPQHLWNCKKKILGRKYINTILDNHLLRIYTEFNNWWFLIFQEFRALYTLLSFLKTIYHKSKSSFKIYWKPFWHSFVFLKERVISKMVQLLLLTQKSFTGANLCILYSFVKSIYFQRNLFGNKPYNFYHVAINLCYFRINLFCKFGFN